MSFNSLNSSADNSIELLKESLDDAFLFLNGITICLMQLGFACLEMGSVRKKNISSVLMKNTLDMFICAVTYWLVGYSLAFGTGNPFLGLSLWSIGSLPHYNRGHWFFQLSFAAAASTIVSGAVAERCTLVAYVIYTTIISGFIYPIVSHWAWSDDGWLLVLGYKDLAGGGVVHLLGGTCALVGAVVLGSRLGRFEKPAHERQSNFTISSQHERKEFLPCSLACTANPMPGHSSLLVGLGGLLLAVTFLSFNGASIGQITGNLHQTADTSAIIAVNTILGGSGAVLAVTINLKLHAYLYRSCKYPSSDIGMTINSALSGMVSVCAGADVLPQWASMFTGFIAGLVFLCIRYALLYMKIDDPTDVVAVHFGGGLVGLLTRPFLAFPLGIIFDQSLASAKGLLFSVLGAAAIISWCSSISFVVFSMMKKSGILRVSYEDEIVGLDNNYNVKKVCLDEIVLQCPVNEGREIQKQ